MNNLNMIAAASRNWGIGKNGDLLFHLKGDMKFFRETTSGNVVVMGRKTLDSFPGGKPLKNRINIVLTNNAEFERENVITVHNIKELSQKLSEYEDKKIFVIGGGEIYFLLLPFCTRAYITRIDADADADTFIHNFDSDSSWQLADSSEAMEENSVKYTFTVYNKVNN